MGLAVEFGSADVDEARAPNDIDVEDSSIFETSQRPERRSMYQKKVTVASSGRSLCEQSVQVTRRATATAASRTKTVTVSAASATKSVTVSAACATKDTLTRQPGQLERGWSNVGKLMKPPDAAERAHARLAQQMGRSKCGRRAQSATGCLSTFGCVCADKHRRPLLTMVMVTTIAAFVLNLVAYYSSVSRVALHFPWAVADVTHEKAQYGLLSLGLGHNITAQVQAAYGPAYTALQASANVIGYADARDLLRDLFATPGPAPASGLVGTLDTGTLSMHGSLEELCLVSSGADPIPSHPIPSPRGVLPRLVRCGHGRVTAARMAAA